MKERQQAEPASASSKIDATLGLLLAVLLVVCAFQIFFRYQYVRASNTNVVRIDRLTNDSCILPCSTDGYAPLPSDRAAPAPLASERPEKVCHDADIVRVESTFAIPKGRPLVSYSAGGFENAANRTLTKARAVDDAVELTDGHVYVFSSRTFKLGSNYWSTGQDVHVCATWSRIEQRPFYSVGSTGIDDPATLAF